MKIKELEELREMKSIPPSVITVDDLQNKTNRTLLYGYTCLRATLHVYLKDNKIHTVIYNSDEEPAEVDVKSNHDYTPDKRAYPECCDFEFCKLLREKGIYFTFAIWRDRPEQKQYWGKILGGE